MIHTVCLGSKIDIKPLAGKYCPYPHVVLVETARKVADWALNSKNELQLSTALLSGIDGLLELSATIVPITLYTLQLGHAARQEVVLPLLEVISKPRGGHGHGNYTMSLHDPRTCNLELCPILRAVLSFLPERTGGWRTLPGLRYPEFFLGAVYFPSL